MKSIIFIFVFATLVCANSAVELKELDMEDENYKFPMAVSVDKKIAEKINIYLQVDKFEYVPKIDSGKIGKAEDLASIEWKLMKTPKNILSISFLSESCGAYCEEYTSHDNFDLRTGDRVMIKQIFTEEGFKAINQMVKNEKKKRMDTFTRNIKKEMMKDLSKDDEEFYTWQLAIYENCGIYDISSYNDFYFKPDGVTIVVGRCSNHASRALDDLGDFSFEYKFSDIAKYLSPYGLSLIKDEKFVKNDSIEGKIFKGTIGKYAITALTRYINDDGSFSMYYWYDKHKIPIVWSGKMNNELLDISEHLQDDYEKTASIKAKWEKGTIEGNWTNSKTGKVLPLRLSVY